MSSCGWDWLTGQHVYTKRLFLGLMGFLDLKKSILAVKARVCSESARHN